MAGHSKWAKVKHFKGAIDTKRSRVFARLSKEIAIASRLGGGDPDLNPRLRLALLKCRLANMPSDNIERAIKRGTGGGTENQIEELTYEIYGPGGVALLAELTTDNRNRTSAEIRSILTKNGGTIATAGAVTRLFQRRGQIIIARDAAGEDPLMELALEAGADDFRSESEGYEILTDSASFEKVLKKIEEKGIKPEAAQVTWLPIVTVPVPEEEAPALNRLIDLLEEHEDVKDIHNNADWVAAEKGSLAGAG